MEFEDAAEETSPVDGLLPLASASQQPYVSELLSFTLDRLHKVLSLTLCLLYLSPDFPRSLCKLCFFHVVDSAMASIFLGA